MIRPFAQDSYVGFALTIGVLVCMAAASFGCTSPQDRQAPRGEGIHTSAAASLTLADTTVIRYEDHQYDRIIDLALDARGRVYIADNGAQRIRGFSPSGESTWSEGGEGAAPTEFKRLLDIAVYKTDSLYALDAGNMKINVYALEDGPPHFQRTIPLERLHGTRPLHIFKPDSTGLLVLYQSPPMPPDDRRQWLAHIDYEGHALRPSIVSVPADKILEESDGGPGGILINQPFRARHLLEVAGDSVYKALSSEAEVTRLSLTGEPDLSLTIADPLLAATDSDLDSLISRDQPGASPNGRIRSLIEASNIPDHYPLFDGLEVDDRGHIWLDVNSTATKISDWVAVHPEGRATRRISIRQDEQIASVVGNRVATVRRRPTGAQDIVLYRLSNY